MKFLILALLFVSFLLKEHRSDAEQKKVRIGIIGGGIGGTSCAFYLKSLFGKTEIEIDLFEAEKLGGRLSVVNFSQNAFEVGGSIIHSRNRYMTSFLKEFRLQKKQLPIGYFALYDGKNFVFSESQWQFKTLWNVLRRYGLGYWKLKSYIDDMLGKFERIYHLQNMGETFDTVESLLAAVDSEFVNYLHESTKLGFQRQGISDIVINEIVSATILANYGQNLNVQKMVGSVSVAGAIGNLWSVHGGNFKIPECLLKASKANFIPRIVTSLERLPSGQIELKADSPSFPSETIEPYDAVVLAAPQTSDSKYRIEFKGFAEEIKFPGRYHKTVCTLIDGRLDQGFFPEKDSFIDEILTVDEGLLFNSVGRIFPVDYTQERCNESNVWKIFTQRELNKNEISSLFSVVKEKYVREWLAYPHYESKNFARNDSFVLASNLYHVNAIEWAASAMEMSAIGAKNVALLIYKKSKMSKSDVFASSSSLDKEEL